MLGGRPVSYREITGRQAETAGLPLADERDAGSTEGALLVQLVRRQLARSAMMPAPAAEVACLFLGCAAWRPRRQRRKARPGRAAARAGATAIPRTSGRPRPEAEAGPGRLI